PQDRQGDRHRAAHGDPATRRRGDRMIRRREFITLLGGAAVMWPLTAHAQQPVMPVIGFLAPEAVAGRLRAVHQGLKETGDDEGGNVTIEYRWAENQLDRLSQLAAELVQRRVAVITTPASTPASLAAKATTTTIPIVFAIGTDPVAMGLVASLNPPGGNATGASFQNAELVAKRLGMLRELSPGADRFVALVNPNTAVIDEELQASALALGLSIEILRAGTGREIDAAFANLVQKPGVALSVGPDAV